MGKETTKQSLLKAFDKVLESKKYISKITVKEIVEEANISRVTFYEYYSDINELVEDVISRNILQFAPEDKFLNRTDFKDYLKYLLDIIKQKYDYYQKLSIDDIMPLLNRLKRVAVNKIIKMLENSLNEYQLIVLNIYIEGCFSLIIKSLKKEWDINLIKFESYFNKLADDLISLLMLN